MSFQEISDNFANHLDIVKLIEETNDESSDLHVVTFHVIENIQELALSNKINKSTAFNGIMALYENKEKTSPLFLPKIKEAHEMMLNDPEQARSSLFHIAYFIIQSPNATVDVYAFFIDKVFKSVFGDEHEHFKALLIDDFFQFFASTYHLQTYLNMENKTTSQRSYLFLKTIYDDFQLLDLSPWRETLIPLFEKEVQGSVKGKRFSLKNKTHVFTCDNLEFLKKEDGNVNVFVKYTFENENQSTNIQNIIWLD